MVIDLDFETYDNDVNESDDDYFEFVTWLDAPPGGSWADVGFRIC